MAKAKGMPKGTKTHRWTDEEIQYVRSIAEGNSYSDICQMVNNHFNCSISLDAVKGVMFRNKIVNNRDCSFKSGHDTWNKGMTFDEMLERYSPESIENMKQGWFQKGHVAKNSRPIGFERLSKDGYVQVKVKDSKTGDSRDNFRMKSHVLWEEYHEKPLPNDWVVWHANHDIYDFSKDNLVAMPRSVASYINISKHGYNSKEELEFLIAQAHLTIAINQIVPGSSQLRIRERMKKDQSDRRHGTIRGWRYGCRCDRCKQARLDDIKQRREAKNGNL